MQIYIRGEYTRDEAEALKQQKYFKKLFALADSWGMETVYLSDWKEYRGTASLDTDNYEIKKK